MGVLDFFSGLLKDSVGNNMDNDPQDVRTAKRNLQNAGYMDDNTLEIDSPFITRNMDEGIKAFQRDKNLKIDGIMNPGGETERGLFESLTGRKADDVFGRTDNGRGSVGFGGNVSGTFAPEPRKPKQPRNPFIFSTTPMEKNEKGLDDKYILSLKDEDKEPEKRQETFPNKPAEYDATGRMVKTESKKSAINPLKPQNPSLNPKAQKALDDAQKKLEAYKKQYQLTPKLLEHYLGKSGEPVTLSEKDIDSARLYKKAIQTNQKRFEDSMVKGVVDRTYEWHGNVASGNKGVTSTFKDQILNLKDGETIMLDNPKIKNAGDSWDRDIGRWNSTLNDPEQGFALGAVKIRSLGNLKAKRTGNKIEITGDVDHRINDTYDFNDDTLFDRNVFEGYRLLAKEGLARPFEVHGSKKQKVTGTLEIKNGRITNPQFKWEDKKE
ncbi:MAG: peptidoglycan-binding protein [Rhodospirillales bacterium]|nr:peptidoglycan-binding protein [Rhodospirillales bacterium]